MRLLLNNPNAGSRSPSLKSLKKRLQGLLIMLPSPHGSRVNWLTNLDHACRPHDTTSRLEFQAGGIPVEPEQVDHVPGVALDVRDEFLVADLEPGNRLDVAPMIEQTLVVSEPACNVLERVGPSNRCEAGLPA